MLRIKTTALVLVSALAMAAAITVGAPDASGSASAAPPTPRPTPKPSGFPVPPPPPLDVAPPLPPDPTTQPGPAAGLSRYTNAARSWAVTFPTSWRANASFDAGGAIFTSFDPRTAAFQKHDFRTGLGDVPRTEVRVNVDAWPNPAALSASAFVEQDDRNSRVESRVREISRAPIVLAGSTGLELVREELSSDSVRRTIRYYVFPSSNLDTMFAISVVPGTTMHESAVDAFIKAFEASR